MTEPTDPMWALEVLEGEIPSANARRIRQLLDAHPHELVVVGSHAELERIVGLLRVGLSYRYPDAEVDL